MASSGRARPAQKRVTTQITEPMTMLTDYALAAVSLLFAVLLFRVNRRQRQISVWLWISALSITAAAAIVGGAYHGFTFYLSEATARMLWKATVYLIGLGSLFMLSGTIVASVSCPLREWLLAATVAKFVVYAVWMAFHDEFRYVVYDYAPAMLGVLFLQIYAAYARGDESAKWFVAGVLVSFAAAGIQQSGFSLHRNFNHNDLYHCIEMGAVYLFYRGGCLLRDK